MSSKGALGGPWGHNLKLTLDILKLQIKQKKALCVLINNFEIYTRYSGVADEKQKKRSWGFLLLVFWVILLEGAIWKKVWETLI